MTADVWRGLSDEVSKFFDLLDTWHYVINWSVSRQVSRGAKIDQKLEKFVVQAAMFERQPLIAQLFDLGVLYTVVKLFIQEF